MENTSVDAKDAAEAFGRYKMEIYDVDGNPKDAKLVFSKEPSKRV